MILHPRMLSSLANFYPQNARIQREITPVPQDSVGEPLPTWEDVLTCPCRLSPKSGQENRLPDQTYAVGSHVINLRGYYPMVLVEMRVLIDLTYYDITAVEHDGQYHTTRLTAQVVT